jgi:transcriptional regulator with XRE-family HTH domain
MTAVLRFGEAVRIAREARGLTLRELSQLTGVSNPLISQIETGKVADTGLSVAVRIARELRLSIDALYRLKSPRPARQGGE